MANNIAVYKNTDLFAPPMTNAAGAKLSMLRFALVLGALTPWAVSSITRSGNVATATVISTANLLNGLSVAISGATGGDASLYNITAPITIVSATTFSYTMSGTPTGSATGTLVMTPVPQGVTSITRSGSTATATLTIGDPSMVTGDLHTMAGAAQSEYNITAPITVLSSTQFTFEVSGSPASPATGTLTHYKAGAGWTEPFTGTNKAVFRPGATNNSARFFLRVLDDNSLTGTSLNAGVRGYVSMSDVDTGTEAFPTTVQAANGLSWRKSTDASTPRIYHIVADDRFMVYWSDPQASPSFGNQGFFGWFPSNKPADAYNCCIGGDVTFNSNSSVSCMVQAGLGATSQNSVFVARGVSQAGGSMASILGCLGYGVGVIGGTSTPGATAVTYPSPAHGGLNVQPVFVNEPGCDRGRLPIYAHAHTIGGITGVSLGDRFDNVQGLPGVTLHYLTVKSSTTPGGILVDITGPWA